jgi:hypothetical protein
MFSSSKPSKSKFAMQLRAAIAKLEGQQNYRYDAEKFRLCRENGNGEINLSNLYKKHCKLGKAERKADLQRVASAFTCYSLELPQTYEDAKPHLRLNILRRATIEFLKLDGSKLTDLPLKPLGSHLYESLVIETENALIPVPIDLLNHWGITASEATKAARDRLEEITAAFAELEDGVCCANSGDGFDSSRILLVKRWHDGVGDPIATVPNRDSLFLAGSEDKNALRALFGLTEKATEEDSRPLSPLPLRLVDGEWKDWTPPKNHVLRRQYDELELPFLGQLYSEQKELLDILLEDQAIFVADFSTLKIKGLGIYDSFCGWRQNVDSLLPKTQLILFEVDGTVVASGEWDFVADIVGDLMVADESYYPVRYRVKNFPSQEQLAAIGKNSPWPNLH